MKKICILSSCLFLLIFNIQGQEALDFTLTDITGKKWHLFEELEKGKTVLLDFFYADCVPCQTLTPKVVQIYSDYGLDTGNLIVFGISDRDNDAILKVFETTYSVNYPSGGIEGNGDSITQAYASWFSFVGWPTYAVVCPNKNIHWRLSQSGSKLDSLRKEIDECILYTSTQDLGIYDNSNPISLSLVGNELKVINQSGFSTELLILDISGSLILENKISAFQTETYIDMSNFKKGMYVAHLNAGSQQHFIKIIL